MSFDINQTLDAMSRAIAGVLADEWPKVNACTIRALSEEKDALNAIALARLSGEIDDAEMQSQIEDEKEAMKAALLACQVQAKGAAQKAANAAAQVLASAIKASLPIA